MDASGLPVTTAPKSRRKSGSLLVVPSVARVAGVDDRAAGDDAVVLVPVL